MITPTIPQDEFIFSDAKYPAIIAGFGAGKTEALICRCIINKILHKETDRAFYEPTYDLIRQIAWPRFEQILCENNVPYRLLKSPHNEIQIEGCGRVRFRSMDNPGRIIGYQVGDSELDELDTLKRDDAAEVWRRALSRNRQKKQDGINTMAVATTPEGFRFVYEAWVKSKNPDYQLIKASTLSNPHLPSDYVDNLRAIYPENLLAAYINGDFVNLTSGTVYAGFDRSKSDTKEIAAKDDKLFIGMDFNVGNMSAVIHVKRPTGPVAVDEVTGAYDTPDIIQQILGYADGRKVYVYPDASGNSRKSVNAAITDIRLLQDADFIVCAGKSNPRVRDRVNAMNAAFNHGYKVNTDRCPSYTMCLEQQSYNKQGEPDKTQGNDHLNDAAGYFICRDYPIIKPVASTNIRMSY